MLKAPICLTYPLFEIGRKAYIRTINSKEVDPWMI